MCDNWNELSHLACATVYPRLPGVRLPLEEERKTICPICEYLVWYFRDGSRRFAARGVLLVMKTLEDERYVVIKVYKCTVSEIWRDFFVLAYIACTSYPYIQSLPTL